MKNLNLTIFTTLMIILFTASSCEVIGGIFKAGFWTAIILIVLIVGIILWLLGKRRK